MHLNISVRRACRSLVAPLARAAVRRAAAFGTAAGDIEGLGSASPWAADPWANVEDTVGDEVGSSPGAEDQALQRAGLAIPMTEAERAQMPSEKSVRSICPCLRVPARAPRAPPPPSLPPPAPPLALRA